MAKDHTFDSDLCYARIFDVLLKEDHGGFTKHSSARNVYDGFNLDLQVEGIDTDIRLRFFGRTIFRIRYLVVSISLYLGGFMGNYYDLA